MSQLSSVEQGRFTADVLESEVPVLVDFWNKACAPCRAQEPVLEQVAGEFADRVRILKLDTLVMHEVTIEYQVRNIPSLALFKGGKEVDRLVGLHSGSDIRAFLDKHV